MVPELNEKLSKVQKRKQFLHGKVKHLISEDDAMFLSDPMKDIQQYTDLEQLQKLGFELDDQQSLAAVNEIIGKFDQMIGNLSCFYQLL